MDEVVACVISLIALFVVYTVILHCKKKYQQRASQRYNLLHGDQMSRIVFKDNCFSIQNDPFIFPYNAPLPSSALGCKFVKQGFGPVDHFFIVNRPVDSARLERMRQQDVFQSGVGISDSNILSAVNANCLSNPFSELQQAGLMHAGFNKSLPFVPFYAEMWRRKGIFGHYLSLYKAFLLAEYNDLDNFLWIEDDCNFVDQFVPRLSTLMADCDHPWDFINLGVSSVCYRRNRKAWLQRDKCGLHSFVKARWMMSQSHAVLFNRSAWKQLIPQFFPMTAPSDVALGNLAASKRVDVKTPWSRKHEPILRGYVVYPELAYQKDAEPGQSLTADSAYWA